MVRGGGDAFSPRLRLCVPPAADPPPFARCSPPHNCTPPCSLSLWLPPYLLDLARTYIRRPPRCARRAGQRVLVIRRETLLACSLILPMRASSPRSAARAAACRCRESGPALKAQASSLSKNTLLSNLSALHGSTPDQKHKQLDKPPHLGFPEKSVQVDTAHAGSEHKRKSLLAVRQWATLWSSATSSLFSMQPE